MAAPEEPPTTPVAASRPQDERNTSVVVMRERIGRADVAQLCAHVRTLLENGNAEEIVCDVRLVHVDAVVVDALCRLQLTARRAGRRIRVRHASRELRVLLAWTGLAEVLPGCGGLRVQPGRETEYGEEARGVEEERDAGDRAP